jgi:pimeloyl-ACP methyl ester carboxylesterase
MPYLDVDGANLFYETVGSGPLFLCIHGGNGSGEIWKGLAGELKDQYTVVYYDRRGFSRSILTGAQDYEHRLETDADDARKLIEYLTSHNQPATIIGNSSGAIVSLALLSWHPSIVKQIISHEPPALTVLPDREDLIKRQEHLYETYRKGGVLPAMEEFFELIKAGPEGQMMLSGLQRRTDPLLLYNTMYWFERELLPYPLREWELSLIKGRKHLLLLANGCLSNPDALQFRANKVLSEKLGLDLTILPGAHTGFASHTVEFASKLREMIRKHESRQPI